MLGRSGRQDMLHFKTLNLVLTSVILFALSASCASKTAGIETLDKVRRDNKVLFTLRGSSFFPIIASIALPTAEEFDQTDVEVLQREGFNMLYAPIDYPDLANRKQDIEHFLRTTSDTGLPVVIELQEWDYWHRWLRDQPQANMLMSNGDRVMTYPDFANPEAKGEHLRRYREMAAFVSSFRGNPVVALSVGAYDYYHIPDGEKHADFSVPPHGTFPQTWLPYGPRVTPAYVAFLKEEGFTPQDVGFESWDAVVPPADGDTMRTPLHWSSWIWFRKDGYVMPWLAETADVVRQASDLPVTITLDVRPSVWGAWATSGDKWAEVFDFIIVYYYGMIDDRDIAERLRLLSHTYVTQGVPMISLLEFSSTLGVFMLAKPYLQASIPYVSGVQFGLEGSALRHQERRSEFVRTALELKTSGSWQSGPPVARVAILLSSPNPYVYTSHEGVAEVLDEAGVSHDVVYELDDLDDYLLIYIPSNQPLLQRQENYENTLARLKQNGVTVVEGSQQDLQDALQNLRFEVEQ